MSKQLVGHVGLSQKGYHEQLLVVHAQTRAAVHISVQVHPAHNSVQLVRLCCNLQHYISLFWKGYHEQLRVLHAQTALLYTCPYGCTLHTISIMQCSALYSDSQLDMNDMYNTTWLFSCKTTACACFAQK